jgi:hypothetical protein
MIGEMIGEKNEKIRILEEQLEEEKQKFSKLRIFIEENKDVIEEGDFNVFFFVLFFDIK